MNMEAVDADEDELLADFLASWGNCYDERVLEVDVETCALPSVAFSACAGPSMAHREAETSEGAAEAKGYELEKALVECGGDEGDAAGEELENNKGERRAGKRRNDPNKARNERTKALRGLRGEVTELSAQLNALQALTTRNSDEIKAKNAVQKSKAADLVGAPPLWEAICRNQLARRVRSERENVRLKRALEGQLQIAHTLERVLKKPAIGQDEVDRLAASSTKRMYALPSDSDTDARIFDMLVSEANAAYYEVDGIFALNGIDCPAANPIRGSKMRGGEHGQYVDLYSASVLPFSLETTAEVVWRFYSGPSKHRGALYYKTAKHLETSENTIVEKFAIELVANETRADFRIWQVMRRYVESDRVMVVWMGMVEPVEFSNKPFMSCAYREKGYVVCKRANTTAGSDANEVEARGALNYTQVQQCHRFVPYATQTANKAVSDREKREIAALVDFVIRQDNPGAYLEVLEDELVRESLKEQCPS